MSCLTQHQILSLHFTADRFSFLLRLLFTTPTAAHFDMHRHSLMGLLRVSASFTPSSRSASPRFTADSKCNKLLEQFTLRCIILAASVDHVRVHRL